MTPLNDTQLELLSTLVTHVGMTEVLIALKAISDHHFDQLSLLEDRQKAYKWRTMGSRLEKLTLLSGKWGL